MQDCSLKYMYIDAAIFQSLLCHRGRKQLALSSAPHLLQWQGRLLLCPRSHTDPRIPLSLSGRKLLVVHHVER